MKNPKMDTKISKPTLSTGPQPRDIRWHSGTPLPVKGDYLIELEAPVTELKYVYWDGENPYVYDNIMINTYSTDAIVRWAYDGDDV